MAIKRVTCSTISCGGLRRSGARVCGAGRPPLHGPPRWETLSWGPLARPRLTPARRRVVFPSLHMPPNFTQRVRLLPANTLLHIPSSCRLRMIAATALCWQGMAQRSNEYSMLEEGRSKLLLASRCPQGLTAQLRWPSVPRFWAERRFGGSTPTIRGASLDQSQGRARGSSAAASLTSLARADRTR